MTRLCLLVFFCFPFTSLAEIPEQLKNDFAPISGTIIMSIGEEYLVDLDASTNLHEGDILTLLMTGEQVIHPDTKKVLGTLDLAKGYLQVTQVKSGYSYAKLLSEGVIPGKGDRIKRFEQTPTRFESTQPAANLAEELKLALPHLNWLNEADKNHPELIFSLTDNSLKVTNTTGAELKSYPYNEGKLSVPLGGIYQPDSFQLGGAPQKNKSLLNQAIDNLGATIGFGGKDKRLENPGITQNQQLNDGIWTGQNLDGNPAGLAVADLDGDGRLETAVAMENRLQILRMTDGKLAPVAIINFPNGVHLLSLDVADIDANGIPELYLTANAGTELSSQVVEFVQGSYQLTINRVPWFFRVIDLPQQGRTLLAQAMGDPENHFSGQPFRVLRSGNKLTRGTDFPLSAKLNLFSFTTFKGANNDLLYAHVSNNDYLHVTTPGGAAIWESGDHFGGTDVFFNIKEDTKNELVQPVYIQKRLLTLPTGEILVPQNDGSRIFERYRNFNKSRVIALKWNGIALQQSWSTLDQNGYLADFTLADADNDGQNELVMVVTFKKKNLVREGRSAMVIYELNQNKSKTLTQKRKEAEKTKSPLTPLRGELLLPPL
ncbi:MAG: VCBS repeat-containing protein [Thermodesulfobacteriota bacterium]|nr:VCBS repeat-containing protein [Thermodesulfobacteriota bacterium]